MERDALIAHGAVEIITERLCTLSDAYQVVLCMRCGSYGYPEAGMEYTCSLCGNKAEGTFGRTIIPYVFKYFSNLLAAMGMHPRFSVETKKSREDRIEEDSKRRGAPPEITYTDIVYQGSGSEREELELQEEHEVPIEMEGEYSEYAGLEKGSVYE